VINLLTPHDDKHARLWLAHAAVSAGFATLGLTLLAHLGDYAVPELSLLAIGGAGTIAIARFRPALFPLPCIAAGTSALLTLGYAIEHDVATSTEAQTILAWLYLAFGTLYTLGPIAAGIGAPLRHRLHTLAGVSATAYLLLAIDHLPTHDFRTPLAIAAVAAAAALLAATRLYRPAKTIARLRQTAALGLSAVGLLTLAAAALLPWELKAVALCGIALATSFLTTADARNPWQWALAWSLPLATLGLIGVTPLQSDLDAWPPITMLATQFAVGLATLGVVTFRFHRLAATAEDTAPVRHIVQGLGIGTAIYAAAAALWLVRHAFHGDSWLAEPTMNEVATLAAVALTTAVTLMAVGIRRASESLEQAGLAVATVGAALAALGSLLYLNPLWTADSVGPIPFFNALLALYGVPLLATAAIARLQRGRRPWLVQTAGTAALGLLFLFVTTQVRHAFAGPVLDLALHPITQPESYTYSAAWIALGLALLAAGIVNRAAFLRFGSLAVMLIAIIKVFVFDFSTLDGLWRIVSFMGLGLSLMALGAVYQRFVFRVTPTPKP
ncbi:MAG: DUF2339 domain-containing protein, partial [Planctomycetota bacterium]